ncbi:hypothetical protein [uncultured Alistipes sp.]|uniref:hypothetical protein n=1 Tax=uncultured Alistipes sp. TaxID=538949 RepID=UPI0025E1426F|nr:hypothetical protein [uncultured Alistipes sp.]
MGNKNQIIVDIPEGFYAVRKDSRSSVCIYFYKGDQTPQSLALSTIRPGVYVYDGDYAFDAKEWGARPADGVMLVLEDRKTICIDKTEAAPMPWKDARNWAISTVITGRDGSLPDRYDWLHICDHAEEINALLLQIGGDPIEISPTNRIKYWSIEHCGAFIGGEAGFARIAIPAAGEISADREDQRNRARAIRSFQL